MLTRRISAKLTRGLWSQLDERRGSQQDLKAEKDEVESQKALQVRREEWFTDREKAFTKKEQDLVAAKAELEADRKSLSQREVALNAFHDVLYKEKEDLRARQAELDEQKRSINDKEIPPASKRAVWGAAAVSPDGAFYIVANQVNEDAATRLALASCSYGASSGQVRRECRLVTKFSDACISVARPVGSDLSRWQWATRSSKEKADADSLRNCENRYGSCTVRVFLCSPDELWPYD